MTDTSVNYEHMIDYVADENLNKGSLDDFLEFEKGEYRPEVRGKTTNPEFPEPWQTLKVNIITYDDYVDFMDRMGLKPTPKLNKLVYENPENSVSLLDFME